MSFNIIKEFKKKFQPLFFLLILFLFFTACEDETSDLLKANETGTWKVYTSPNTIPGDRIWDIMLDSKGNLWFATIGEGVTKFDGTDWTVYNSSNSGLLNDNVTCIEEDGDGDMWFGTLDGISFLVDDTDWLYLQDPDTVMNVQVMKRLSNNNVWVGSKGAGYYVYDGTGFYKSAQSPIEGLNIVNTIEEDNKGNIWLGTNFGALMHNGQEWSWFLVLDGLPANEIWSIYSDSKGKLWFGTAGGATASWYDGSNFHDVSLYNGQSSVFIKDIWEDRNGDLWFATWFDGAIRYDGVVMYSYKEVIGFFEDDLMTIAEDELGQLWFAGWSMGAARYTLPVDF